MPNTSSAIRRVRRVTKQTAVNRLRKSKYRAAVKKMEEMVSERVTQCGTIADLDSPSPKATKKAAIFPTTTQRISEKKAKPFFHAAISGDKSSKGDDSVSFFGFTITK